MPCLHLLRLLRHRCCGCGCRCCSALSFALLPLRHRCAGRCADRHAQLIVAYAPDWIITLVVAGLLALVNDAYGFRREFSLTDTSLQVRV